MLLLAFLLGLSLAWVVDVGRRTARLSAGSASAAEQQGAHTIWAQARLGVAKSMRIAFRAFPVLLILIAAFIFFYYLIASYLGVFDTTAGHIIRFATTQFHISVAAWFTTGYIIYFYRRQIARFARSLLMAPAAEHRKEPTQTSLLILPETRDNSQEPSPPRVETREFEAREWLTAAGGLPLLTAGTIAAILLLFADDLRSSWRTLKVVLPGIQADFVAAQQETVRLTVRQESSPDTKTYRILGRGQDFEAAFPKELKASYQFLSAETPDPAPYWERLEIFHKNITFQIACVSRCYIEHFPSRDTEEQQLAVTAAGTWGRLSNKISVQRSKGTLLNHALKGHFCGAINNSLKLLESMRDKLRQIKDELPGPLSKNCQKALDECHSLASSPDSKACPKEFEPLEDHISELLSSGTVISFISNFIAASDDYERAITHFEEAEKSLKESTKRDPIGNMYYYLRRAQMKYSAHWHHRQEALQDLARARDIADHIIAKMRGKDESSLWYFEYTRALITNNELYYTIRDWLDGYHPPPETLGALKGLATKLEEWLKSPSIAQLRRPTTFTEPSQLALIKLAAAAHDTLAMNDIMVGSVERDFNRPRCERIRESLTKSLDILKVLTETDPGSRGRLRIVEAHHAMFVSACGRSGL